MKDFFQPFAWVNYRIFFHIGAAAFFFPLWLILFGFNKLTRKTYGGLLNHVKFGILILFIVGFQVGRDYLSGGIENRSGGEEGYRIGKIVDWLPFSSLWALALLALPIGYILKIYRISATNVHSLNMKWGDRFHSLGNSKRSLLGLSGIMVDFLLQGWNRMVKVFVTIYGDKDGTVVEKYDDDPKLNRGKQKK